LEVEDVLPQAVKDILNAKKTLVDMSDLPDNVKTSLKLELEMAENAFTNITLYEHLYWYQRKIVALEDAGYNVRHLLLTPDEVGKIIDETY